MRRKKVNRKEKLAKQKVFAEMMFHEKYGGNAEKICEETGVEKEEFEKWLDEEGFKKLLEKATVKKMIFRTDVYKLDIDIYYVTTHTSIIKEPSHFLKKKQS